MLWHVTCGGFPLSPAASKNLTLTSASNSTWDPMEDVKIRCRKFLTNCDARRLSQNKAFQSRDCVLRGVPLACSYLAR